MTKVRYEIEVDADMFPYAPGSEVVARYSKKSEWCKDVFLMLKGYETPPVFVCKNRIRVECYPIATHGHLLGTTYPADTPACSQCGKAAYKTLPINGTYLCAHCVGDCSMMGAPLITTVTPKCAECGNAAPGIAFKGAPDGPKPVCAECFGNGRMGQVQPTATTAEPNASSSAINACKEEEVSTPWWAFWYNHEFRCFIYVEKDEKAYASKDGKEWIEVMCVPKHIMAEKWRVMHYVNSRISSDPFSANSSSVVSTPDHASTPEQLPTIAAERDALRAELEALSASTPTAQPGEFQPFQRVLVRDRQDCTWRCDLFSNIDKDGDYRCVGSFWRHVIPYDGNAHLLGTTDSPD